MTVAEGSRFVAGYVRLYRSGELAHRAELAVRRLVECDSSARARAAPIA